VSREGVGVMLTVARAVAVRSVKQLLSQTLSIILKQFWGLLLNASLPKDTVGRIPDIRLSVRWYVRVIARPTVSRRTP
jgi:hypothetical protein